MLLSNSSKFKIWTIIIIVDDSNPCYECNCQTGPAHVAASHAEEADDQHARQQCWLGSVTRASAHETLHQQPSWVAATTVQYCGTLHLLHLVFYKLYTIVWLIKSGHYPTGYKPTVLISIALTILLLISIYGGDIEWSAPMIDFVNRSPSWIPLLT